MGLHANIIIAFIIVNFGSPTHRRSLRLIRRESHPKVFANRRQTHMRGRRLPPYLFECLIAFERHAVPNMVDRPARRAGNFGIDRLKVYAPAAGIASPGVPCTPSSNPLSARMYWKSFGAIRMSIMPLNSASVISG